MKAAFLVGRETYEVRNAPEPVPPEDGLVLAVEACGVCGSDLRRWREGPPEGAGSLEGLPGIIAGHEIGGTVVSVGRAVRDYAVGDRLAIAPDIHCGTCWYCRRGLYNLCDELRFLGITPGYPGGFAERMVLTREVLDLGVVHPIPEGLSSLHAALAEPMSSVLACHEKAGTNVADTVAIMGAGPIGCLHAVIAKLRGARVIISQRSETRLVLARSFAPDVALGLTGESFVRRVRELTGGRGADLVVVANGVASAMVDAVQAVRKGGRVVLFGGLPKADPRVTIDANRIHYGDIELVGAFSYHPTMHALALDLLQRGVIPADELITHVFPLDRIAEAFEAADSGAGLKVVITP